MTASVPASKPRRPLRTVLIVLLVIVLLCCGGAVAGVLWVFKGSSVDTFGKVDFVNKLAVPPLAASTVDAQGRRVFELTAQSGNHDFGSGQRADTWGFNGSYLGPTLRAAKGEQVLVNVHNRLSQETSVHWHGMHLPAKMDGGPHQSVRPGTSWAPEWKIDQPASTLWYHPHPHGETAQHVYRGLAGMFILDDPAAAALALPDDYGVDDVPVIVQDKNFAGDSLDTTNSTFSGQGILGETIVVNGTVGPYLDVNSERVRLRLLNGSNSRVFDFGFDDDRRFQQIASDGGLLAKPYSTDRIQLSPGERAEIVVQLSPGERPVLRAHPPYTGAPSFTDPMFGNNDQFDVLQLRAAGTLTPSPELPAKLAEVPRIAESDAVTTRKFKLSGTKINDQKMDMTRLDASVAQDSVEIWEIINTDGKPHSFHVHDVQFQVLSVGGGAPSPELAGWKDTVFLPSQAPIRIIMRFSDFADPDMPYMFHCHVLYHEDSGMMGQFVVLAPGQQAGRPHQH